MVYVVIQNYMVYLEIYLYYQVKHRQYTSSALTKMPVKNQMYQKYII